MKKASLLFTYEEDLKESVILVKAFDRDKDCQNRLIL